MSTREDYPAGVPCWVDTNQPDPADAARWRRHHAHPGRPEPLEQPGAGNNTSRTTTSGATSNSARSGSGPHGPDHRTTPAHMARCQLFNLQTCAVPQSRVRTQTAALSLALTLDHQLNGRSHRRLRHATNRQNNRICASTTLVGSPLTAAPNGGTARFAQVEYRSHDVSGRGRSPGS